MVFIASISASHQFRMFPCEGFSERIGILSYFAGKETGEGNILANASLKA
jgi:hypothetical protein